ncbi:MAG: 16S rRNA (adenine(1518)-N(6)/adenine(1519)-N(6))-dimethyltransferase, partial [Aliifodinibius sp.]|nr:16S rRNA (adenine(1518)-N(6)/adenine(1519)-N(6))-dimethyltransferase [candidate division Zixibacteria bacterium]NIT59413.1 16S rRNA (adenine(1518)-N(6)/adenine(1519)-N(6))-dimethyltransferase [Fodinibius sp.]NIW46929.1 16S rRNA (adenine(1518)-N(6)/adenine(1519)-N(6))-dimethyltransferase [Gammaproteobacteria bacterium]NIR65799.1 16S rRNA (adenine(1518)-N(6)/adenine(1519)-N(6))-dimethyltransferase [candidate division Zixibacteria bacterium]NIS47457.1 16S rRNA (adenine(1518)-N(6)/adenine(1519)-
MNKPAHPVSEYSTTELLRAYGIDPKKSLGQNFIINNSILKDIVRLANVTSDDLVLEIGAGVGNLTQYLAKTAKKVIAVE